MNKYSGVLWVSCAVALVVACSSRDEGQSPSVSVDTALRTQAKSGNDGRHESGQVSLCHMPPGSPYNVHLITVGAPAAANFEARGDGACANGAYDCCVLNGGTKSICTDFQSDAANCGACGKTCGGVANGAPACSGGACGFTCSAGYTACGAACVSISNDVNNCGTCGNLCPGVANGIGTCTVATCGIACNTGYLACPANNPTECLNVSSDPNNCGACGNACPSVPNGSPSCDHGSCGIACNGGFTPCGSGAATTCVETSNDPNNCGGCGVACPPGQVCSGSACNWPPLPGPGCYAATYPNIAWAPTQCQLAPVYPLATGNGADNVAQAQSGVIGTATGGFTGITGLTSENDVGNSFTFGGTNDFSLQINANKFSTSTLNGQNSSAPDPCAGNMCIGWEQFVLTNYASFSPVGSNIYIQFWLIGYHKQFGTCPNSQIPGGWESGLLGQWRQSGDDCFINSPATSVPIQNISSLGSLRFVASANMNALDVVMLFTSTQVFALGLPTNFLGLNESWSQAEFNVFGLWNSSEAVFNPGTTMTVTNMLSGPGGTAITASCQGGAGSTAETNNLNLACPCFASGGGISFTESNAASPTCACPPIAQCGGTCCLSGETCLANGTCCPNTNQVCNGTCCPNPLDVCDPNTGGCAMPCPQAGTNCGATQLCCFNSTAGQPVGWGCFDALQPFPWCGEEDQNLELQCNCPAGLQCKAPPCSGHVCSTEQFCQQ